MPATSTVKKVVFLLTDISGYTQFILANQKALEHAQVIVTELMQAILDEIDMPLEIYRLEGDAIFLYAIKSGDENAWAVTRRLIGRKLEQFFVVFKKRLGELQASSICSDCMACQNIDKLNIKMIVHSGEAAFSKIGRYQELGGRDVIIAHKLLKNSVGRDEYVLVTETGAHDIDLQGPFKKEMGEEDLGPLGLVKTVIYLPETAPAKTPLPDLTTTQKRWYRFEFYKNLLLFRYGLRKPPTLKAK